MTVLSRLTSTSPRSPGYLVRARSARCSACGSGELYGPVRGCPQDRRRKSRRGADDGPAGNGAAHDDTAEGMAFAGYDDAVTPFPTARDDHARVGRYGSRFLELLGKLLGVKDEASGAAV